MPIRMNMTLKNALAICRRVFIALSIIFGVGILSAWWLAPNINDMRPEIEVALKDELQLKSISLQNLSWYWAGYIGFKVEHCDFETKHKVIAVKDTALTARLSLWNMLRGKFVPNRISLSHGKLYIHADAFTPSSQSTLPPIHVLIDDMDVQWRYAKQQGVFTSVVANIDGLSKRGFIRTLDFQLQGKLNQYYLPKAVTFTFDNLNWLPAEWAKFISEQTSGELRLKQLSKQQWALHTQIKGHQSIIDLSSIAPFQLPFDNTSTTSIITFNHGELQNWDISHIAWQSEKSQGIGKAQWHDGKLTLEATSPHLSMPLLWSWLRPLDDDKSWHHWLGQMQAGTASDIQVALSLPWQRPLKSLPDTQAWKAFRYHVTAQLSDTDIALGFDDDRLTHTQAHVDLDEHGLTANISHTELPYSIGSGHGTLTLPWHTLMLNIQAAGDVDAGKLQTWVSPQTVEALQWDYAPASMTLDMQWDPRKALPDQALAQLKPIKPWQLSPEGLHLQVNQGTLIWDINGGLQANHLDVSGQLLKADLSFHAQQKQTHDWELDKLQSNITGNLASLVTYYHIPIEQPSGALHASVMFDKSDKNWHGNIDFKHGAWKNLLGSKKASGKAMQITFQGQYRQGGLQLTQLTSLQAPITLRGSGSIHHSGLKLNLTSLQAPAFQGALKVHAPFGKAPWEMDIQAVYLNRTALPKVLPKADILKDKPWALRAHIKKFVWDDASMVDVSMQLASKSNSAGVFKAKEIKSGALLLNHVSALFALPGGGNIDLRQLSAAMGEQHLMLSASLEPEPKGGMRWRGFAQLDGNFGDMMQRAELSALFADGDMKALFLGQGVLFHNQPWWEGLRGRLRLRVNNGTILKGGTLTKTLAAVNLMDLPDLFFGNRKDLTQSGLYYRRLQVEASLYNQTFQIHKLGLRSSAMDIAGQGQLDLDQNNIDLQMVVRPFQNLDALLAKIPLVRDLIGGSAHSLIRKIYHMHGPIANAKVDQLSSKEAGLAQPGLIERLLTLPDVWFGKSAKPNKSKSSHVK